MQNNKYIGYNVSHVLLLKSWKVGKVIFINMAISKNHFFLAILSSIQIFQTEYTEEILGFFSKYTWKVGTCVSFTN